MGLIDDVIREKKLILKKEESEIVEKDSNGDIIHYRNSDGFEYVSDEAFSLLKKQQLEIFNSSKKKVSINELVSKAILNGVQ